MNVYSVLAVFFVIYAHAAPAPAPLASQAPAPSAPAPAPSPTQSAGALAGAQAQSTSSTATAPSSAQANAAEGLMTCATPHNFTQDEIKAMNQVFGIMILLLQYQLFVNADKSGEQETYNQLLPMFRTVMNLFKNMK